MSRAPEADGNLRPAPGRRRGRRRGLDIRPGSVKQARQLAGLSLGQVARADISRTAIYFVETGKAKPSQETLELIAARTGQPLEFFLTGAGAADHHPAARLAEIERLLAAGDNRGVVEAAEHALAQNYDPGSIATIKLVASLAYLRLAQPVVGRRLATAARSHFEQSGDLERVAECLANEASAAMLMQDPTAVPIAEGALETCRSLQPVPRLLEVRLLGILGNTLVAANRWPEAIAAYEEAIAAGDVVQDLRQLSLVYSGLSVSHQEMGRINDAARYAQKALALHETLQDRLSQARSLNNLGWMLLQLGERTSARTHLTRALQIFDDERVDAGKAEVLLSLAELELAERNVEAAAAVCREALVLTSRLGEYGTASSAHLLLARMAAADGRDTAADDEFGAALQAADVAGGGQRTVDILEAYADVLEARGDLESANRSLRQALAAQRPSGAARPEPRIASA